MLGTLGSSGCWGSLIQPCRPQPASALSQSVQTEILPPSEIHFFFQSGGQHPPGACASLCLGSIRSEVGHPSPDREVCRPAGQAERPTATAGREIAFPTAGSSCQSNWGAVRKPLHHPPTRSKLCPGRSNKTPGVLRHRHSSCLGRPIPSKATPKINGKRFIRGLGGELLTTSGSPFVC